MNREKIGRFIADCRKSKKMTQEQLSEKLNITSKAVSKWETGKCLPDASIMMDLSNILEITVTELLSGEKISKDKIIDKADENLVKLSKSKEASMQAARLGYIFFAIALLSLIMYNSIKYGIERSMSTPEFFIVIIAGIVFWFTYLIVIKKKEK